MEVTVNGRGESKIDGRLIGIGLIYDNKIYFKNSDVKITN